MRIEPRRRSLADDPSRFRLLIDAVVDYAIYMLDPAGIVAAWNPGAERIKGYAAREIVGRHFSCFCTEADRRSDLPARARLTRGGGAGRPRGT